MAHHVVIVGVGALGSHLALLLRNVEARVTLVDFDRVEAKNVLSQFHTKMGLGKNKALALQQSMRGLFGVEYASVPHKLVPENVEAVLGAATLVVDCLDNAPSRQLVQDFVRSRSTPCLHGALAPDGQFGRVIWDEQFVIDAGAAGAATCEDGEHLPFVALVSAELARAVQRFLATGAKRGVQIGPAGAIVV